MVPAGNGCRAGQTDGAQGLGKSEVEGGKRAQSRKQELGCNLLTIEACAPQGIRNGECGMRKKVMSHATEQRRKETDLAFVFRSVLCGVA